MAVDATAMGWAFAPIRRRGKTARPRGVQPRPAAAEMIRASVTNRVDNGGRVRQWRFTAAADRSAAAPFC